MKNKITEILGHDISWNVNSKSCVELDECSIEHIETCIKDGITQGELTVYFGKDKDKETNGWWSIINWKDIALELRNSIDGGFINKDQIKAVKRFDDIWTY